MNIIEIGDPLYTLIASLIVFVNLAVVERRMEKTRKTKYTCLFYLGFLFLGLYALSLPLLSPASHLEQYVLRWSIITTFLFFGTLLIFLFTLSFASKIEDRSIYEKLKFYFPILFPFMLLFSLLASLSSYESAYYAVFYSVSWILYYFSLYEASIVFKKLKIKFWYFLLISIALLLVTTFFIELIFDTALATGRISIIEYENLPGWKIDYLIAFIASGFAIVPGIIALFTISPRKEILPKEEAKELEGKIYALNLFQFVTRIANLIGGSTLIVFKSSIRGYNERFNKGIRIDDTIHLSNIEDKDWPKLLAFLIDTYYQCIGPIAIEEAKKVEGLEEIAEKVEERYGKRLAR
jgi:hypothetical protein